MFLIVMHYCNKFPYSVNRKLTLVFKLLSVKLENLIECFCCRASVCFTSWIMLLFNDYVIYFLFSVL